jgi:hypothetical protein
MQQTKPVVHALRPLRTFESESKHACAARLRKRLTRSPLPLPRDCCVSDTNFINLKERITERLPRPIIYTVQKNADTFRTTNLKNGRTPEALRPPKEQGKMPTPRPLPSLRLVSTAQKAKSGQLDA